MNDIDIEFLIREAKKNKPDAFTKLMQFYMKDMYKVAVAILMNDDDASDAIQDTILTCWEKIHSLRQIKYFRTWMTRILINKCYDIRRKHSSIVSFEEYQNAEPFAEDTYNLELKEALSVLDEKYRIVIMLFYGEGYHMEEIAKILKLPKSTIQARLQHGREKLANYL